MDLSGERFEVRKTIVGIMSEILPVYDDCLTVFHKSLRDWLKLDGYEEHAYCADVADGKRRLWRAFKKVYTDIDSLSSVSDFQISPEKKYALENDWKYFVDVDGTEDWKWFAHVKRLKNTKIPNEAPLVDEIFPKFFDDKNHDRRMKKEIIRRLCGLLNSHHGGILKLTFTKPLAVHQLDQLLRGIQQSLIELFGIIALVEYVKIAFIDELRKVIVYIVNPANRMCTMEYNLFLPADFLVTQVRRTEPLEKIAVVLKSGAFDNRMLHKHVKRFEKTSTIPGLREADAVQFKNIKSERNKNKSLADRMLSNKIKENISAFANRKGGHIYFGIDDKTYKVCGEVVVGGKRKNKESRRSSNLP